MISKIILLLGAFCAFTSYGQTYSYSFNGNLSNESVILLNEAGLKMNQIEEFKIRYKEDSHRGEVLIVIDPSSEQRAEADNQFSTIELKSLLIEFGLEPISFHKINQ